MRTQQLGSRRIDIVEVGGRSGVFQHAVAMAELLTEQGGASVVHTATDHEPLGTDVHYCTCFRWLRSARHIRAQRIALSFVLRTIPHLVRQGHGTVWVQGAFKPGLTLLLLVALRLRGAETVFSPHNLFSRSGSRVETWLVQRCVRVAEHVVAYNAGDHERLQLEHRSAWLLPLVQFSPAVPPAILQIWRNRLPTDRPVVCAIGHIREDKNLPLLIEGAARAGVAVVVVGPDAGGIEQARQRADDLDVDVRFYPGYHQLEDLGAVLAVIGVVVCPYAIASQSGVARLARSYGAVVVAADVGGLPEQADVVIERLEPQAVAAAILNGLRVHARHELQPAPACTEQEAEAVLDLVASLR